MDNDHASNNFNKTMCQILTIMLSESSQEYTASRDLFFSSIFYFVVSYDCLIYNLKYIQGIGAMVGALTRSLAELRNQTRSLYDEPGSSFLLEVRFSFQPNLVVYKCICIESRYMHTYVYLHTFIHTYIHTHKFVRSLTWGLFIIFYIRIQSFPL